MKKLLLITGDLATGKTTFARMLSERFDIPAFYKDTLKEALGDTIGFQNREENLKLSRASYALMLQIFRELARHGGSLILESNFRSAEQQTLVRECEKCGYEVKTLIFRADDALLYERFLHRAEHENRHPVHLSGFAGGKEDFFAYINKQRGEEYLGPCREVSASDFGYQQDAALFSEIETFLMNL